MQRPEIDWGTLPVSHPVCEQQTDVPTLRLQPHGQGHPERLTGLEDEKVIVVQWFGDDEGGEITKRNIQFAFPVMSRSDDIHWFGHPEWFRVAYFGPLEHWPNPAAIPMFQRHGLEKDSIVLYVLSAQIGMDDGKGGVMPNSFMTTVALLGDPCFGVIRPRKYENMAVCKEEIAKLAGR
ncbi:MAG TPA: hypothetical protein VF803_01025 [Candidatus Paceibacterota bacterium]